MDRIRNEFIRGTVHVGRFGDKVREVVMLLVLRLGDQFYKDAIEHCRSYNARLCAERTVRMPFLDSQTGVAQNNCYIWMEKRHRGPGLASGQMYTYPARCWRKKRRLHPPIDPQLRLCELRLGLLNHWLSSPKKASITGLKDYRPVALTSVVMKTFEKLVLAHLKKVTEQLLDPLQFAYRANRSVDDAVNMGLNYILQHLDCPGTYARILFVDFSSTFNTIIPGILHSKLLNLTISPAICQWITSFLTGRKQQGRGSSLCGKRYKNRPGLSYHYTHTHLAEEEGVEEREPEVPQSPPDKKTQNHKLQKGLDGAVIANDYCDFCLGDSGSNRKTGQAEELVSCSDCGRSGHPTCLQFTENMMQAVRTYQWQCIECKSCSLCGTSENDDQLLFCDDCDRGYHMYCLKPPMTQPPEEGSTHKQVTQELVGPKAGTSM
ncbi:zinc finger protein DPF3 [Silurus meridionalis]|nr:zinc finger protein DPF3 [Silurus meridionalis]